jgi:FKBP-type peptidyl-prolyl cis-trans isomerase
MKLFPITLPLAALVLQPLVVAQAQDAPPADKPAPAAAPESPALLPPAAVPATDPAVPDPFKSEKERLSYVLGTFFATQEKNNASAGNHPVPNVEEVIAGLKEALAGGKSADYVSGATIGVRLKRLELDIDPELLFSAMRESFAGQPPKLPPQQQQLILQAVQTQLQNKAKAKRKEESDKALAAANEFLAANAKAEGVQQTPSGLQYKLEKPGEGKSATDADMVTLNYTATVLDGPEFEKNPAAGPARKPVRMLPKGVQEALTILKTGGKGRFWVPPALAFGETGRHPNVKTNVVCVYDLELLGVEPLPKPATPATTPGQPARSPVTAVTPPITVEIPPKPAGKNEPPKSTIPAPAPPATAPVPVPPAPPAPPAPPGGKE